MKKEILLIALMMASSTIYGNTGSTSAQSASSTAALNELRGQENLDTQDGGQLFYIVDKDDFSQVASLPGFSFGAPSGLVPGWGVVFGAVSGTSYSSETDGGAGFGIGWGDPYEYVGGTLGLGLGSIDVTDDDDKGFSRGTGSVSIGKIFKKHKLGVSAGISTIDLWHADSGDKPDSSYYFAATKIMPNDIAPVIATAGIGNEAYSSIYGSDSNDGWKEFFSVAAYIHPQMSLITDYTSGMTTVGVGLVPMPKYPVTVSLGANDVFKQDKDTDSVKFVGSIAAAYVF